MILKKIEPLGLNKWCLKVEKSYFKHFGVLG